MCFQLTDASGNVTAHYENNAWGQELRDDVLVPTGATNRLRYQTNWTELKDCVGLFKINFEEKLLNRKFVLRLAESIDTVKR